MNTSALRASIIAVATLALISLSAGNGSGAAALNGSAG